MEIWFPVPGTKTPPVASFDTKAAVRTAAPVFPVMERPAFAV